MRAKLQSAVQFAVGVVCFERNRSVKIGHDPANNVFHPSAALMSINRWPHSERIAALAKWLRLIRSEKRCSERE